MKGRGFVEQKEPSVSSPPQVLYSLHMNCFSTLLVSVLLWSLCGREGAWNLSELIFRGKAALVSVNVSASQKPVQVPLERVPDGICGL